MRVDSSAYESWDRRLEKKKERSKKKRKKNEEREKEKEKGGRLGMPGTFAKEDFFL